MWQQKEKPAGLAPQYDSPAEPGDPVEDTDPGRGASVCEPSPTAFQTEGPGRGSTCAPATGALGLCGRSPTPAQVQAALALGSLQPGVICVIYLRLETPALSRAGP